jgi:tetratricopeptide (TPR) repeat protein
MQRTRSAVLVAAALAAGSLALFAPTCRCAFVNYDDPDYVTENPSVQAGLTGAGITWAFTRTHAGYWHPLTWLSLQLDASLFGLESAWGFHLTNVVLHAASTVLLFLALRRMTGVLWRPALVAALFAVHPMHVESVAWVTERKDVLSGLFWMLALLAYARYVEEPTLGRSLLVLAAYALGLMAKPMLVTLPCVLLLLDYWPLRRPWTRQLLWEKLPLFALTVAACPLTLHTQHEGGAVPLLAEVPLAVRAGNALLSYCLYLLKTVWPTNLGVLYPYPAAIPLWQGAAAAVFLVALTAVAVRLRRRAPYLLVGWLWFLGTLVPVIGLVQAGAQALADRFSYLPSIGLFLAVVWGGGDLLAGRPAAASLLAGTALAALVLLCVPQVLVWHDSLTLWQHARKVSVPSALIDSNLGLPLAQHGHAIIETNLASALAEHGEIAEAVRHYAEAVRFDPDYVDARYNLAGALTTQRQMEEAARRWEELLRLAPEHVQGHLNYAGLLARTGQKEAAARHFRLAGEILARQGKADEATAAFQRADLVALLVENPWFRHWSGFPTGTAVTRKRTTFGSLVAAPSETTVTTRLVEKEADRVVLEVVTVGPGGGSGPTSEAARLEIPRMVPLPAGVKEENFGSRPEGAGEEGIEKVKIAGQERAARWYKVTTRQIETKLWLCDSVPGKVVRSESRAVGTMLSSSETVELVAVTRPVRP